MFKPQIKAQLLAKYAGALKKLSPKALELLVDKISGKVTEEAQIEGVLTELDNSPIAFTDYVDLLQAESDRRVTDALAKARAEQSQGGNGQQQQQGQDGGGQSDDTPAWAKALLAKVEKLEAEKAQGTILQMVDAKAKELKVPQIAYKFAKLPEKADEVDAFMESLQAAWTSHTQEQVNAGAAGNGAPPAGSGAATTDKVDPDLIAFAKAKAEAKN